MSEYQLDVVPLTEGLNFNTATSLAKPGSLRDVLNYEFVDGAGLKRIDGMRLYDGNMRSKADKIFFLVVEGTAVVSDSVYADRPWLYVESNDNPNKVPFGYIAWNSAQLPVYDADDDTVDDTTVIPFIRLDCPSYADPSFSSGNIKILNSAVLTITEGTFSTVTLGALDATQKTAVFGASTATAKDELDVLLDCVQETSYVSKDSFISILPGAGTAPTTVNAVWAEKIGNTTYEIGDAFVCSGTSAKQVYPGDYVYVDNTNEPFLVLKSQLNSGSWANGTATLHIAPLRATSATEWYSRDGSALFTYDSLAPTITLYRDTAAAAITSLSFTKISAESDIESQPDIACMYRVDSELGALTNDAVFSVIEPATEGTLYDLSDHPVGVSAGDAEGMSLITGGAVKAIVPTKRGSGYDTAPTFTIPASGGTAATASNASLTKTINRTNWQFVHTGWVVPFREGNKKYGYLNKIDRYKDIDGNTYSASSSVTGLEPSVFSSYDVYEGVDGNNDFSGPGDYAITRFLNNGRWKTDGESTASADVVTAVSAADSSNIYLTLDDNLSNVTRFDSHRAVFRAFTGSTALSSIPEGSSIKGVKVTCVLDSAGTRTTVSSGLKLFCALGMNKANQGGFTSRQYGNRKEMMNSTPATLSTALTAGVLTDASFTAGGSTDLFGASNIPLDEMLDPGFSVGFWLETGVDAQTEAKIQIDHVFIDVYYELPSVRYYFKSNATSHGASPPDVVIHGDLVDYVITGGSLEAGDATGYMTIVNLRTTTADSNGGTGLTLANSTVPYYTILSDMDIYQDSGTTVKIGETSGEMTFNGFDSYRTIKQNGSRYTSVRSNFFANDEYEAFYICSGAGRAGIWDSKYWSRIYAINPKQTNADDLDKPRHVGTHNFHLMLGYKSGSVLFSAPGNPSNFSAFDGAGEIGIGDKIRGFNRLQGNAFGVFCEESIHAITGTDASNFTTQILVPNEGALEYSVASFGNRVIYTSKTGITTLDQSEKYGNFTGRRLSFDVNPWLIPRITGGAGLFTQIVDFNPVFEAGNGYVCAYAVPHKNQYRLWFKDGLQLWMTLVADDMPKFTFVQYFSGAEGGGEAGDDMYPVSLIPNYVSMDSQSKNNPSSIVCPDREFIYSITRSGYTLISANNLSRIWPTIVMLDVGDSFDAGEIFSTF